MFILKLIGTLCLSLNSSIYHVDLKGVGPLSGVFGPYLKTYNLLFFFIKKHFFFMLCICFSPRVHLSWILGKKHENNTKNADFWKLFIEEKANAEQIIQLSHTM